MTEIWKDIKDYEGLYQVSNLGRVRRITINYLKPRDNMYGYYEVGLSKKNCVKVFKVHRLVCSTFKGVPKKKMDVHHIDGNRKNNCVDNLEWVTHQDNCRCPIRIERHRISKSKTLYQFNTDFKLCGVWVNSREVERQTGWSHGGIDSVSYKYAFIHKAYGYYWSKYIPKALPHFKLQ